MRQSEIEKFFLKEKPVMALVTIERSEDVYCRKVSKKIDTTYAHTVKIISRMEEMGLVRTEKQGRKKILELSPRGERYSELFRNILRESHVEG